MPGTQTIRLTTPEPDIALLTFDMPGRRANLLPMNVQQELATQLDALARRNDLAGVVICSGKPKMFSAGADLREVCRLLENDRRQIRPYWRHGQDVFRRLSSGPLVTVAAVDGICVGGGAELASWCDDRVLARNSQTRIGFPEVRLGLVPAWGGTVRVPRLVGLGNALEWITRGEPWDTERVMELGWASDLVPPKRLIEAAIALIRSHRSSDEFQAERARRLKTSVSGQAELQSIRQSATSLVRKRTHGHDAAAEAVVGLMLDTALSDEATALEREADCVSQLCGSPANKALLNVFFLTDRNKKDRGVDGQESALREIHHVGLVGAGVMGCAIAVANLQRQLSVSIADAAPDVLQRSQRSILDEAAWDMHSGEPNIARMAQVAPLLRLADQDADLSPCDLVLESIVENLDVKQRVLTRLEPFLSDRAILASNTSAIPISRLAECLTVPDRFCGIHFCNPVRRRKLVEIVRGDRTADRTVAAAVAYAKRLGKMPIVVQDGPGFLVNRLLYPYLIEAFELISEGTPLRSIETAAEDFGMSMGPLALCDLIGNDTTFYAGRTMWDMWESFRRRIVPSPILPAMIKTGRLGEKAGKGFYLYADTEKSGQLDPALGKLFEPYIRRRTPLEQSQLLQDRLLLPMLVEATRALEEGIVRNPRDVDLAAIFGLGFPAFKGGLLFWADRTGAANILARLERLEDLGPRAEPTDMLRDLARHGKRFYPEGDDRVTG